MENLLSCKIDQEIIEESFDYAGYRELIDTLLSENKTTGPNQSESYLEYTRMNVRRMNRWDKTAKLSPEIVEKIRNIFESQTWLVITEAWCGDAAQTIPYIVKLASENPLIKISFILRDEYPEIMDDYLTEGARSIPKLIALDEDLSKEIFTWGPRPEFLQKRLKAYKEDSKGVSGKEFSEGTHLWYAKDKNRSLERELLERI